MTTTSTFKSDKFAEWCEEISAKLIAGIDTAEGGFVLPWQRLGNPDLFSPKNVLTGKTYQGGNVFALFIAALQHGYDSGVWGTYRQWEGLGAQVRKGEHGTGRVRWVAVPKKLKSGDVVDDETKLIPRFFVVFNAAQVDGWTAPAVEVPLSENERFESMDVFIAATGADIRHGGDRAYYQSITDHIQVPEFAQFTDGVSYYSTVAHELTHWTGNAYRINRRGRQARFGDEAYAFEELIAEMGAAMVLAHFGLSAEPRADHAQYLKSWVRVLADQPKALWTAAGMASKAVAFLLDLSGAAEVVETEEVEA